MWLGTLAKLIEYSSLRFPRLFKRGDTVSCSSVQLVALMLETTLSAVIAGIPKTAKVHEELDCMERTEVISKVTEPTLWCGAWYQSQLEQYECM